MSRAPIVCENRLLIKSNFQNSNILKARNIQKFIAKPKIVSLNLQNLMKAKTLSVINELMYFEAVDLLLMIGQKLVPRLNLQ